MRLLRKVKQEKYVKFVSYNTPFFVSAVFFFLFQILFETRTWPWALMGDVEPERWKALFWSTARVMRQSLNSQVASVPTPDPPPPEHGAVFAAQLPRSQSSSAMANTTVSQAPLPYDDQHRGNPLWEKTASGDRNSENCSSVNALEHRKLSRETPDSPAREEQNYGEFSGDDAPKEVSRGASKEDQHSNVEMAHSFRWHADEQLVLQVYRCSTVSVVSPAVPEERAPTSGETDFVKTLVFDAKAGQHAEVPCVYAFPVVRSEGPHKRAVHWVPQIQTGGKEPKVQSSSASDPAAVTVQNVRGAEKWKALTVKELKEECSLRGLRVSGRKSELAERLRDFADRGSK